ncbi:MAG: PAS domain S-box protein, partial [Sphaerospermopsis sp. SIO1G2]|nr:PAS domain S-box protein [Sphaerospermopsis sp. SIO1G2]
IVKYATDITEVKKQYAYYQSQIQAINRSQAVIHFDLDGHILDANENFLGAVGYELEEIQGQHHRMFMPDGEADTPEYQQFWQQLGSGEFMAGQFKRRRKDGKALWIDASYNPILDAKGEPVRIVKYATDITEVKKQYAYYQSQIQAINRSQAVIHFDLDGHILDANENFLTAVGYELEEIQGQHHRMFMPDGEADTPEYQQFWQQLGSGEFMAGQFKRRRKDGKALWIDASYNPILDTKGQPVRIVKYATDITAHMVTRVKAIDIVKYTETSMQGVAAAVEQLSASIQEISRNMVQSKEAVDDIAGKTKTASTSSAQLENTSNDMGGIVEIIRDIAEQVNLLALNATIEAARAGESGKGFAVVASEVKSLAVQTTSATDDIAKEIHSMVTISKEVATSVDAINSTIISVIEYVTAVASAIEEQSAVTGDISSNIQSVSKNVYELNDCVRELAP